MPTYEYQCPEGHSFEKFQKMSEKPRAKCPVCDKPATRKISGGAGLVFKGSGFYITDYGKDGKGPRKPESESAPAAESKPSCEGKPDTAKRETKAAAKSDAAATKPAPGQGKGKATSE
jgi:putative FmdB family regulatory protein